VINGKTPDGKLILTESNFKGPLTVSNSRIIDPNDPRIQGILKTTPKKEFAIPGAGALGGAAGTGAFGPLGQMPAALSKLIPAGIQKMLEPKAAAPVEAPKLSQAQIQAIGQLPDDQKKLLMQQAPEIYSQFIQQGGGAKSGGKALTDTAVQNIIKFENLNKTVDQLEGITKSMSFDPVTGKLRGMNPWDPQAQQFNALKASITGPAVRAIMSEVGALTESDLSRVDQLLPKLDDTKETVEFKLRQLKDLLTTGRNNYISTYGQAGYDVGNFSIAPEQSQYQLPSFQPAQSDLDLWNSLQ